jgi:hypothetical protein
MLRKIERIYRNLKRAGIKCTLIELEAQCLAIAHDIRHTATVINTCENLGYKQIYKFEYIYSFGHDPKFSTIIY